MENTVSCLMPPGYELSRLHEQLEKLYTLEKTGEEQGRVTYLDTWDWRLFSAGYMLGRVGYTYTLYDLAGTILAAEAGSRKSHPFSWDFQEGELRERLTECMDVRALLPQFIVETKKDNTTLFKKSGKTALQFSILHQEADYRNQQIELQPLLVVQAQPGRNKPRKKVAALLQADGFEPCADDDNPIARLHRAFGVDPNSTSSKFAIHLSHEASVAVAVQQICTRLKEAMEINLPGVLEDIDSEFLHDFRVAVRRTRSLLSVLKKYLPMGEIRQFQDEFKWLGTVTGPVRDLDVYLLMTEQYRAMLPEALHPGLASFFRALENQRKRELRRMVSELQSERFKQLMEGWQQFLALLPGRDDYPAGDQNCKAVAEKIIRRRFKRILKDGGSITPQTEDARLHELRIEGKKFRYILEFFRSLFDEEATRDYLKQMKKLQNNLGDFNDYSVQQEVLLTRLQQLVPSAADSLPMAAALGGLIVHLGDAQREVRKHFEQTFEDFATPKNIDLLEQIFSDT